MTTLPITLRDEHQNFIMEAVKSGAYITQSDVVATALELLKAHEELRKLRRAELKREIDKGIEQLDRGETVEFNLRQFLAQMRSTRAAS